MARPYRLRSAETWERAREDYFAGDDAFTVCDRYDIGLSNLRRRAKAEGWRRADQADMDAEEAFDAAYDEACSGYAEPTSTVQESLTMSVRLAEEGRITEAGRWLRYHRSLMEALSGPARRRLRAYFPPPLENARIDSKIPKVDSADRTRLAPPTAPR